MVKKVKLMGQTRGIRIHQYPVDWLLETVPGNLPTTYPDPLGPVPRARVGSINEEVTTDTSAGFQFHRLPVHPIDWSVFDNSRKMVGSPTKAIVVKSKESCSIRQFMSLIGPECGRSLTKFLANVGKAGCESKGGFHSE